MIKEPLISVIIPVYNVDKYLEKCVLSILNQTYKKLQIILVDDGSTDNSGNICDWYCKNAQLEVVHKSNGGLSSARNKGIEKAEGDYISFLDSDDFVSKFFFEIVAKVINETDVDIVALEQPEKFWDGDEDDVLLAKDVDDYAFKLVSNYEAMEEMFYFEIATGAPFKICRKSVFNSIRFPEGYLYEDIATTYREFLYAERIAIISSKLYAYRKRMDGIIRQDFSEKKLCIIKVSQSLINDIDDKKKDLVPAAIYRVFPSLFGVFLQVPSHDVLSQKLLWNEIVKYRGSIILNSRRGRLKDKIAAITSFLGMKVSYILGRKFGQKGTMYR